MKKVINLSLLLCLLLGSTQVFAQKAPESIKPGSSQYTGVLTQENLSTSYKSWFTPRLEAYEPSKAIITTIAKHINNYDIKVFMGTWCPDSRREVPHLYKILERTNFDTSNLDVYTMNRYKATANNYEKGLNINYVPSIIFFDKNGNEVNRIVEFPQETLEKDILKIVTQQEYHNVYAE